MLSAVVVAPDRATIATLIGSLAAQAGSERIELVVVAPRGARFEFEESERRLGRCTLVEVDGIDNLRSSRAAGIEAAAASLILIAETHCYPAAGWLDAVLAAHEAGWAVVGPGFENANPASAVSWANFADHYARFWRPPHAVAVDEVGGHNSTARRADLLALGDELPHLLRDFPNLQRRLATDGGILLEPAATMRHVNMSRVGPWMKESWAVGRVAAASRARAWGRARRWGYALAWPLLAAVEWWRRQPPLRRLAQRTDIPRAASLLLPLGLLVRCAGEAVGFVTLSGGGSEAVVADTEVRRLAFIGERERLEIESRITAESLATVAPIAATAS
jgi:hypothetical protein